MFGGPFRMYKISDFTKPVYKTGEIMEILNISYSTIKVYDKKGTLPIKRTGFVGSHLLDLTVKKHRGLSACSNPCIKYFS